MKKTTLYERLKEICRDFNIPNPRSVDIHSITKLTPSRISQIQRDDDAKLGGKALMQLIEMGYNPTWLQHGEGEKKSTVNIGLLLQSNTLSLDDEAPLPIDLSSNKEFVLVQRVKFKMQAGITGFSIEVEEGNGKPIVFRQDWFDTNGYKPEKLFAVRVKGASMEPSLWEDDLVVVNTGDAEPSDGDVFAINYEGELAIKRFRRDAGEWWATSDNADQRRYAPKRCTDDVRVIGRIVYKQSERI